MAKPNKSIANLNHRHKRVIAWLRLNKDKTQGECAEYFGYTEAWLSHVVNSDMFQLAQRRSNG